LKILSRITEPSAGRVTIKGRVASLLEVGTGFHPELTGRENIYLNGAILGMTRAEIRRKFDEIVAFAEVEKFLDTPVKRYSSGMYVRLAFAVAAHLEPDILVVDEVLAVGDAEFQKKCLARMSEVASKGRTVLFVSHNMGALRAHCTAGFLLANGRLRIFGNILETLTAYAAAPDLGTIYLRPHTHSATPAVECVSLVQITEEDEIILDVVLSANEQTTASIDVVLKDQYFNPVGFGSLGVFNSERPICLAPGKSSVRLALSIASLANGEYFLSVYLTHPFVEFFDKLEDCVRFQIARNPRGGSIRCLEQKWGYGCIALQLRIDGRLASQPIPDITKQTRNLNRGSWK
jgi:lipopolysaccharide transport system ATP-binding protein